MSCNDNIQLYVSLDDKRIYALMLMPWTDISRNMLGVWFQQMLFDVKELLVFYVVCHQHHNFNRLSWQRIAPTTIAAMRYNVTSFWKCAYWEI